MKIFNGVVLLAAVAALLAACSGGPSDSSATVVKPTTSTAPPPGTSHIVTFDVPPTVQCTGGPSTTVAITYVVSGAKSESLLLDGRETSLSAASGSVSPAVHCDGVPHTVVLRALDEHSHPTTQEKILKTILPGAGG